MIIVILMTKTRCAPGELCIIVGTLGSDILTRTQYNAIIIIWYRFVQRSQYSEAMAWCGRQRHLFRECVFFQLCLLLPLFDVAFQLRMDVECLHGTDVLLFCLKMWIVFFRGSRAINGLSKMWKIVKESFRTSICVRRRRGRRGRRRRTTMHMLTMLQKLEGLNIINQFWILLGRIVETRLAAYQYVIVNNIQNIFLWIL